MHERIRELRKSLGLTMDKFGERLGVGKTAISKIENKYSNPSDQLLKSICREFHVNEEWLRNGTGEMKETKSENILDELVQTYNLSNFESICLNSFLKLNENDRCEFCKYLFSIFRDIIGQLSTDDLNTLVPSFPNTSSESKTFSSENLSKLSIDEKVALYRQELEREEKNGRKG